MVITHMIRVSGRVHGVGFRSTAMSLAYDYKITGYVENDRENKNVIMCCQGDKDKIHDMIKSISNMNGRIRIDNVNIEIIDDEKYNNFIIR